MSMVPSALPFSDFVIFVDESGDHSLTSIDADYPLFVLSLCIVRKTDYATLIVPRFLDFKFEFFGHDMTILHAHDIRKPRGDFSILLNATVRERFMTWLNGLIESVPFTIIAVAIRKLDLKSKYATPHNPYDLALRFGLERVFRFLWDNGQQDKLTHIIAESRGRVEDKDLELQFLRVSQNKLEWATEFMLNFQRMPLDLIIADKKTNSIGMQLADLIAHPIGRRLLKPGQTNRAYDVLQDKFLKNQKGEIAGWGLKIFP